jgi:hypothetical protein
LTVGVVIDLIDPMQQPPNIPEGSDHPILTLPFSCVSPDCPSSPSDPAITANVSLCDDTIGDPLKENLIVVGGMSIGVQEGLVLQGGTITWVSACIPSREICNGVDDDCDGEVDEDGVCDTFDFEVGELSADGRSVDALDCLGGFVGGTASGMLWFNSPDVTGETPNSEPDGILDSVQGFSLGLVYPCDKIKPVEALDISGTTLDAEGAEFVGVSVGTPPPATQESTGDTRCSMVIAVLLDAVPEFKGQVIPPLPVPQPMGMLSFELLEGFTCNEDPPVQLVQTEGVRGRGTTPVYNLISVENYPYSASMRNIKICRKGGGVDGSLFYRGDCNYSMRNGVDNPVEISDAAAVVSYLFGAPPFDYKPPCLDACDANDDARINIGDALAILYFLFVPENTYFLPDPYPGFEPPPTWPNVVPRGPGIDPTTADPYDCAAGEECVD